MGKFAVDFSDVQTFEPLPEGDFRCRVEEVVVKRNKADDGDYLNWTLEVIEGEFAGRKLWLMTSLKTKALWKLKEVFEALGIEGDQQELEWDDDTMLVTTPELVDIVLVARVTQELYQDRLQNKVGDVWLADEEEEELPSINEDKKAAPKAAAKKADAPKKPKFS
jgi:hypothetical protein